MLRFIIFFCYKKYKKNDGLWKKTKFLLNSHNYEWTQKRINSALFSFQNPVAFREHESLTPFFNRVRPSVQNLTL